MGQKTPLYDKHIEAGARIVDFGGWDMPVNYGSQKEEHHAVRGNAGMFDVSHMTIVDLSGNGAQAFLRHLLANDVGKISEPGKAMYTCMLNERGGVIDDLIVYYFSPSDYRLVVNAATRDKDLAWINEQAQAFDVSVTERPELAMIAVQGPKARALAAVIVDEQHREQALALKPFTAMHAGDLFVARTGYTGEDGWEIVMPASDAPRLWDELLAAGIAPCGLGARDTLRLEAAMNLYGTDMDEDVSPLEAGLGWTIAWEPADRDFIGRAPLEAKRADVGKQRFVGLLLEDKGVLKRPSTRSSSTALATEKSHRVAFRPPLSAPLRWRECRPATTNTPKVDIRGRLLNVRIVKTPFVRNGQIRIDV